jgi:hypothetical protein
MDLHHVLPFGIVHPIEMGGFTNRYGAECARGRNVIIIEGNIVVGFFISLPFLPLTSSSDEASHSSFDEEEEVKIVGFSSP